MSFFQTTSVTLNSFQGPSRLMTLSALAAGWVLKQVQHDELGGQGE